MSGRDREEAVDEGLLNAAAVDQVMVAEQLGVPLTVRPPRRPPANT